MPSNSYFIARNYGQNPTPGRRIVQLGANVIGYYGNMIVELSGYGVVPAAANAATAHMAGMIVDGLTSSSLPVDNTGGADGALSVVVDSFDVAFANDGTHPCSQADVGNKVYASSGTTISNNSADGPPAGKLIGYNASDVQGRPCLVALECMRTAA